MPNTIYTPQDHLPTHQLALPEKVRCANEVVQKIHALTEEAEGLLAKAQNERKIAKNAKRSNFWMPFVAPLIAFAPAFFMAMIASSISPSLGDPVLFTGIAIFTVVIWFLPKINVQKYLDKAVALEQEADNNYAEIERLRTHYQDSLDVIPPRYQYPIATAFIADVFQTGRVKTIGAALDKYEEQLHRWKVESAAQEAVALQMALTSVSGKGRNK